jgi:radical SAM protein with 4Fe4S-binding SPASM domain
VDSIAAAASGIREQTSPFAVSFHGIGGFDANNLRDYFTGHRTPLKRKLCAVPFISMHIVPNGDMVFCIDYPHKIYGNLRTHSLREAWNSAEAAEYRRWLLSTYRHERKNPSQCHRCNWMFN